MKLVIVGPYPLDNKVTGGVEAVLLYLLQGLKKIDNLEIHVISSNLSSGKPKTVIIDGIKVHYFCSSKFLGNLTLYAKNRYIIRKKIKAIKPDIVHFHDNFAYIGSKPFCPTILTLHGIQNREILFEKKGIVGWIRGLLRLFFERLILQKNKNIIALNPYSKQEIQKISSANIYMISNPIDDIFFKARNTEMPNRILCLAPVYKLKNIIDLIKAVELLKKEIPEIELHIGGHIKDPEYFEMMKTYISEHALEYNIKYLGHISEDKVIKEYEECCLLAHSSLQENSPMVIQQAMATGKPVVATKTGGTPYLVKDSVTGYLVECNDVNELAKKIKYLLNNSKVRKQFGKTAKEIAVKNFKSDTIAKLTYNLYQNILKKTNSGVNLNKPKKLLFVIPALTGGGAERVLLTIINNLDNKKYDINLVLFSKKGELVKNLNKNIKIITFQKRNKFSLIKLILQLRNTIKTFEHVTVISLLYYTNIISVLSCLGLRKRYKLIICEHNNPRKYLPESNHKFIKNLLMKFTYKKADIIVTISKEMRENLIIDYKLDPQKVDVIYNPIPIDEITILAKEKSIINSLKIKNKLTIIAAGRLTRQKRFDRLIRSFAMVRKKLDVRLLIIGQGELLDELKYLTNNLNISEDVVFLGFQKNPYALLSISDIFVLSSDYEGFPMVLLESLACGTPIISTDCSTGPKEIITNGKNGILVPVDSEKELADSMITLLKNIKLRKKFSINGKLRANDFATEKILPQYESLF